MLENLALWVVSPFVANIWLNLSFVIAIVPMIGLTLWYHGNIEKTEGGKRLMEKQTGATPTHYDAKLGEAAEMARGIADGKYGSHVKSMQMRAYLVVAIWLVANIFMFGLMIWGQELEKAAGGLG